MRPAPVPDDEEHAGPAVSCYAEVWRSRTRDLVVGVWEFRGEQTATGGSHHRYEEVVVLTAGHLNVTVDGRTHRLEPGDVIVYDTPIGSKVLRSEDGFRAVYIIRYRAMTGAGQVKLVSRRAAPLTPLGDDDGHSGVAESAFSTVYETPDQLLQVGLWSFSGAQHASAQDGYEEVVVITSGTAAISLDGETHWLATGDSIVYDCPIGGKHVASPDGFEAAYVVRLRQK